MVEGGKSQSAFRTIGELSAELGLPQHILRYWETRFSQLKPLQRAGNRRYYRPEDVALAHRINRLLNQEGYTVRGVQKLLGNGGGQQAAPDHPTAASSPPTPASPTPTVDLTLLSTVRDRLARALAADDVAARI